MIYDGSLEGKEKNKEEMTWAECAFVTLLTIIAVPIHWMVEAWALMKLWRWFVIPTFGLPMLTRQQAIGLCMIVGFLTYRTEVKRKKLKTMKDYFNIIVDPMIFAVLMVMLGWLAKTGM